MNKNGDVSIILLFVIALVLSVSALFIFASFGNDIKNVSRYHNDMLEDLDDKYSTVVGESQIITREVVVNCKACSNSELKQSFMNVAENREKNVGLDLEGNYFARIRNGDFDFYKNGENYVVNISDLFVNGKKEYSAIKRNFNLTVEYDQEGNFIRFINK